jgi:hypothetical protein
LRQCLDGVDSRDEPGAINLLQLEVEFLHLEIAFAFNGGFARQVDHRTLVAGIESDESMLSAARLADGTKGHSS